MTLTPRDRRALLLLGAGIAVLLIVRFGFYGEKPERVVAAVDSIPAAERRLARLRLLAATVPGKQSVMQKALAETAEREKGIIVADTAAQAQAHILETVRRLGKAEGIDVRGGELGQVRPLADYGQVAVAVGFDCRIEQLVNFLAALTREKDLVATNEIRITATNPKQKTIGVRLSFAGVVPRKLVVEKKGSSTL
jgi:hypothetical protein